MIQMNIFTKQKQTHRLREQIRLPGGRTTGRDRLEAGINIYILRYIKQIINKDLL